MNGLKTSVLLILALIAGFVHAADGSRGCKGTGKFIFYVEESQSGSVTRSREFIINILEEDLNVVVRYWASGVRWKKYAKEGACRAAARAVVSFALFDDWFINTTGTVLETVQKKPNMERWRRKIACDWVRSGEISGIGYRKKHRMTLKKTRVDGVGVHADSGHKETHSDSVVENHICWEDSRAKRSNATSPPTRDKPDG